MPKLKDLKIRGVALVDRGANQHAKVLISKRVEDTVADEKPDELKTQLTEAEAKLKAATDELAALKSQGTVTSDLETLKKQLADAEKAVGKERIELQEQVTKALKEAEDARAEVVKIKQARRRENFIKRVQELKGLPGAPADDFAEILDAIEAGLHQVVPEKAEKFFAKFNQYLTSWNAIVSKSAILEQVGRSVTGPFRGAMAQMQMLAKELRDKDSKLTEAQAFDKVMVEHPDLYRKYQTEKES